MAEKYVKLAQDLYSTQVIKTWPGDALLQLHDCFHLTVWPIFEQLDLETFTKSVLFYIECCAENVTVTKNIWVFPNLG